MVPSAAAVWRFFSERVTMCHAAELSIPSLLGVMEVHSAFLSLVTLTFDL